MKRPEPDEEWWKFDENAMQTNSNGGQYLFQYLQIEYEIHKKKCFFFGIDKIE